MASARPAEIISSDLRRLTVAIAKGKNRLQIAAVQKVLGLLLQRIFNRGGATEGQIGKYAATTLFSKRRKGQETGFVNLEDTEVLFNSVQSGKSGNDVVLGIVNTSYKSGFTTSENAVRQEQHFKKDIFAPTNAEITAGEDAFLQELLILTQETLSKKQ